MGPSKDLASYEVIDHMAKQVLFGHHSWPAKKILDFRWSKKAEITLEIVSFW